MALILYMVMLIALATISWFLKTGEKPAHGLYTSLVYPAVETLVSLFLKKRPKPSSADFMVIYGRSKKGNRMNVETAVNISSLIIFLSVPVAVYTLSDPGGFELFVCYCISGLGYFIPGIDLKQRAEKERNAVLRDFSIFCMDLAVLAKAVHGVEEAWRRALKDKPGSSFYKEAHLMTVRMEAGTSLEESMIGFARRLGIPEIYSFATVVNQAVKTGSGGAAEIIRECAMQSWERRYRSARENGEKASVKMVFPLAMGLTGVIIIVAFPAFAAMKGLI